MLVGFYRNKEYNVNLICSRIMVDATNFSTEQIVSNMFFTYVTERKIGDIRTDFYCGITNDLDIRMNAHRRNDFLIEGDKVFAWKCRSADVAAEVEHRMGEMGFDIGDTETFGNGGTENSCIVYLLKKGNEVGH